MYKAFRMFLSCEFRHLVLLKIPEVRTRAFCPLLLTNKLKKYKTKAASRKQFLKYRMLPIKRGVRYTTIDYNSPYLSYNFLQSKSSFRHACSEGVIMQLLKLIAYMQRIDYV